MPTCIFEELLIIWQLRDYLLSHSYKCLTVDKAKLRKRRVEKTRNDSVVKVDFLTNQSRVVLTTCYCGPQRKAFRIYGYIYMTTYSTIFTATYFHLKTHFALESTVIVKNSPIHK